MAIEPPSLVKAKEIMRIAQRIQAFESDACNLKDIEPITINDGQERDADVGQVDLVDFGRVAHALNVEEQYLVTGMLSWLRNKLLQRHTALTDEYKELTGENWPMPK